MTEKKISDYLPKTEILGQLRRNRNEDEEVITLGNTPEAWSWQTAADRS